MVWDGGCTVLAIRRFGFLDFLSIDVCSTEIKRMSKNERCRMSLL